jgi:carboxylate-amine ligase
VLSALLDAVRPALADAGDEERVARGVAEVLRRGTGAAQQRRVHERTGDPGAVVRAAVRATVDEPGSAPAVPGCRR